MMYEWVMAGANRRERLTIRPLTLEKGGGGCALTATLPQCR